MPLKRLKVGLMLNKILFGVCILFGIGFFISYTNWQSNKDRADRTELAYKQSENENVSIKLKFDELKKSTSDRIKYISDSLDIKYKKIQKYVTINTNDTIIVHDTVYSEMNKIDSNVYEFIKDTACFNVTALVKMNGNIPSISFPKLIYDNNTEYIVYNEKEIRKFLFIKWRRIFGKGHSKLEVINECGKSTVQEIEIIKK